MMFNNNYSHNNSNNSNSNSNNNSNNIDMAKLMQMLSKMDKRDLEAGIAKANQILQNKSKNEIMNNIKNNKQF